MNLIINHLPALQVLIPLFGGLFAILSFNRKIAEIIALLAVTASFILSVHSLTLPNETSYSFGDWQAPVGIEYKLDFLNQPLIIFINFALLFVITFCKKYIDENIIYYIQDGKQFLFYPILLFVHTGYLGIVSTNDLFNLYVFIEISSLSAYILIALGKNPKAQQGAFDYLILGSIGATLILIGIGFLLSYTGTLNISDIKQHLIGHYSSRIVLVGSAFILLGSILKIAFFPLHFWMVRAYSVAPSIILSYLASISGIVGICIILRFLYFAVEYNEVISLLAPTLRVFSLIAILLCSFFASKAKDLKKTIIYSAAAQTGYLILLLSIAEVNHLILQFLLFDGLNKISLFLIISQNEDKRLQYNSTYLYFTTATLICSVGLPISSMFLLKVNILETLASKNLWVEFVVILIGSVIGLLYHYRMFIEIYKNYRSVIKSRFILNREILGMALLIALQISMLMFPALIIRHNIWNNDKFLNFKNLSHIE